MTDISELKSILIEIRDNQEKSISMQKEHIALVRSQLDHANEQANKSLKLQEIAVEKQR